MNKPKEEQQAAAEHIPDKRQDNDKTPRRIRVRSGEGTVAYWKAKLFRNTYRDRGGRTVEIPEYYARMRHDGVTKRVRLGSSDKDKAAELALALSGRLSTEGWRAVAVGQARLPASPTIDEFCTAYARATESMRKPPRPISVANYVRSLKQLCALAGVRQIRELNKAAIGRAGDEYRLMGRKDRRKGSAITNTWAKVLRNAAACFSANAREIMERNGLKLENPFDGIERSQEIRRFEPLSNEVIHRLMKDFPLLLSGDANANDPASDPASHRFKEDHGRRPQWRDFDYRQPQRDAYVAFLLAFFLGLRANEIDKARWNWIGRTRDGDFRLSVPDEEGSFRPKGGEGRIIPIQKELVTALFGARSGVSRYMIGGPEIAEEDVPSKKAQGLTYRNPGTFRKINLWLRERGVESGKARGHPLHTLRKQFGSMVATEHGLFQTQHVLGHKSPLVTSKYYATPTATLKLTHFTTLGDA